MIVREKVTAEAFFYAKINFILTDLIKIFFSIEDIKVVLDDNLQVFDSHALTDLEMKMAEPKILDIVAVV